MLAIIIVAFVFTIGNTPGCTTDRSNYEENLFYGVDINSPLVRETLVQKVSLSAFLNNQQFRTEEQFQNQLSRRIALLHLADEIGIATPDQAILAEYIKIKNAFRGPDGNFSADAYTRFVDQVESNPEAPKGLVITVLEEDYRIEQVNKALSGPGYLLPSEAKAQALRSQTQLTLATAELAYDTFEPEISADENALIEYYEANKARYEIPERIEASYIVFKTEDYSDQIPDVTDADLREHFAANRARFVEAYEAVNPTPQPAEGEETPEPEPVTFEKVRLAVTSSFESELAERVANEAAQAFAYQLYRDDVKQDSTAFTNLLEESGLSLTAIEPYTFAGSSQRALSAELLQSAFSLSGGRYYSDAYPVDGGFAVLIYQGRIAPEIPAYEIVEAEVKSDYEAEEKRSLFNEKGESLKAEIEAKLETGISFVEAAEALELKSQAFESFAVRDAPIELNRSALQTAQSMQPGELSPMLTIDGVGTFVYLEAKETPEISEDDSELTQATGMLERWASFTSGMDLVNELVFRGIPEEALIEEE